MRVLKHCCLVNNFLTVCFVVFIESGGGGGGVGGMKQTTSRTSLSSIRSSGSYLELMEEAPEETLV